jgi:hypothetical protein
MLYTEQASHTPHRVHRVPSLRKKMVSISQWQRYTKRKTHAICWHILESSLVGDDSGSVGIEYEEANLLTLKSGLGRI